MRTFDEGRQPNGRFAKGYKGGPGGNRINTQAVRLRNLLYGMVSDDDFQEMVLVQIELAKGGDKAAFKILCEFLLGKPQQSVHLSGGVEADKQALNAADLQIAIVQCLADEPAARAKVIAKLKELHNESSARAGL